MYSLGGFVANTTGVGAISAYAGMFVRNIPFPCVRLMGILSPIYEAMLEVGMVNELPQRLKRLVMEYLLADNFQAAKDIHDKWLAEQHLASF